MTKPEESAFPRSLPTGYVKANDVDSLFWEGQARGMSKREYFAGMALRGVIEWDAVMHESRPDYSGKIENIVKASVGIADALIAELNK